MKRYIKVLILIFLTISIVGCTGDKDSAKARQAWAEKKGSDIVIGIAGRIKFMKEVTKFLDGVYMAVDEINGNSGVNGRKIQIVEADDKASTMEGTFIAQKFVDNPKVVAVIGHTSTHVSIPTSTIYEKAGVVMLSPIVSNPKLTQRGYQYVFQNIPSDYEIGKEMAIYAKKQGHKRIAIYYADTPYGKGLANAFEDVAVENGITIIDRTCSYTDEYEFERAINKWKALDVDGVFVADSVRTGKEFILKIKETGIDVPILGGDGLDANFIDELGEASEGAAIATIFNPDDNNPRLQSFIDKFEAKYKDKPDVWALQGYDSIMLLAHAIEKADSSAPSEIAKSLRSIEAFQGVTDKMSFDENGRAQGKVVYKKIVRNGKFQYLK